MIYYIVDLAQGTILLTHLSVVLSDVGVYKVYYIGSNRGFENSREGDLSG